MHGVQQVVDPFVKIQIDGAAIHELDTRIVQRPGEPFQDPLELGRVLLERCDQPGFAATCAGEDEVEREQSLTDPRGASQQRRGTAVVAIRQHGIQRRDARGHAFLRAVIAVELDGVGHARKHMDTRRREPVGVLARQGAATAQFDDRQHPPVPFGFPVGTERDDGIGDGELGRIAGVGAVVLTDPEGGDRQRGQPPGKLVQEPPERLRVRCVCPEGPETVDH